MKNKIIILISIFLLLFTSLMIFANNDEDCNITIVDNNIQGPLMEDGRFYSNIPTECQKIIRVDNNG